MGIWCSCAGTGRVLTTAGNTRACSQISHITAAITLLSLTHVLSDNLPPYAQTCRIFTPSHSPSLFILRHKVSVCWCCQGLWGGEDSEAQGFSIVCHGLSKATVTKTQSSSARTQRSSVAGKVTLSLSFSLSVSFFHPLFVHICSSCTMQMVHRKVSDTFFYLHSVLWKKITQTGDKWQWEASTPEWGSDRHADLTQGNEGLLTGEQLHFFLQIKQTRCKMLIQGH